MYINKLTQLGANLGKMFEDFQAFLSEWAGGDLGGFDGFGPTPFFPVHACIV